MLSDEIQYINEEFRADHVQPDELDRLLANAWRHFGTHFFRYSLGVHEFDIRSVIPLRTRLSEFSFSKSLRRVLSRNNDLLVEIRPAMISDDVHALFERHKRRFKYGVPESIFDFVSDEPSSIPSETKEVAVFMGTKLVAVSYFDTGQTSSSGIYAMFEPDMSERSLGIFTMLKEIEYSINSGFEFYYQGYAYEGESFYDYKKRLRGTEGFDWSGRWVPLHLLEEQVTF